MNDDLLRELLAELRAIRRVLEARHTVPGTASTELLRTISAHVGDRVFSAAELVEYAYFPEAHDLRGAILAGVGTMSARRVGRALRRLQGRPLGGFLVERVGADRLGALWVLRVCSQILAAEIVRGERVAQHGGQHF